MTREPAEVFFSYSHRDENLRNRLEIHLAQLRRENVITGWHDRKIGAGDEWRGVIDEQLERAQIILLLVSADFLASDYISDVELTRALERHNAGEAVVIPVILRPTDWATAPFAMLQALPKDARPVTKWRNRDEAFANIAEGLRNVVPEPAAQISSSPGQVVAADATTDPVRWHASLRSGVVEVELDPNLRRELYTFVSVVSDVLREKGFRRTAVDRVAIILRELLANVAHHVPGSKAWVTVDAQDDYLQFVSIAVYDSGPGIKDLGIIADEERRLVEEGDREHGLLRIARLTDDLKLKSRQKSSTDKRRGIWCEVFDPEPPSSVLFKHEIVAPVCVVYEDASSIWLGQESYTGDYLMETLVKAVKNDWRPLLDLYFAPLLSSGASYIGVEITGYVQLSTDLPYTFPSIAAALEMYFGPYFKEKRVIVLIHDTDDLVYRDVKRWVRKWGIEYFESRKACRQRLRELEKARKGN
jgi:anti-sigma regulatory factor (Ser/Thr protein kinase)